MGQAEGIGHVGVSAPGGSRTALHCDGLILQPFSACGFETLIHGASAVDQGPLAGGTPMGAVPLTAVTLHAIRW